MRFLVLRLEGPLMSFGDAAVDELRRTRELPGLSMLTGLAANALGLRFTDGNRLGRLQERLVYGARLDRKGQLLRDFQTAQLNKNDLLWRSDGLGPERREGGEGSFSGPTLRERFYRADSRVCVVLSLVPEDESPTLDDLAAAFARPFRPLFLGRVCCPPSGPLHRGEVVDALDAYDALERAAPGEQSDPAPLTALWPADGPGARRPVDMAAGRIVELHDLRDWRNDVHSGSRYAVSGPVHPCGVSAKGEVQS